MSHSKLKSIAKKLPLLGFFIIVSLAIHAYLALRFASMALGGEMLQVDTFNGTVTAGHSVLYHSGPVHKLYAKLNPSGTDEGVELYISKGDIKPCSWLDPFCKPQPKNGTGN
jgi:hypothetical protein